MMVDAASQKMVLRRQLMESFGSFNPAVAREAADRMVERLFELPEVARASRILTCLSFQREIDMWRLVDRLLGAGGEVYGPRADPRDRQLHVHRYPCDLEELSFGLKQPSLGTCELNAEAIDGTIVVALALGLAFDPRGYRLGSRTAYFDRFMPGDRSQPSACAMRHR